MDIKKIQESVKRNIMENVRNRGKKPEHAKRGAAHQRPKSWSGGVKSGSERTRERRKGKQEIQNQMNEDLESSTSVFRPQMSTGSSPLNFSAQASPETSQKPKREPKSFNTVQTEIIKNVLSPERKQTQRYNAGAEHPVNTEDTPQVTLEPESSKRISSIGQAVSDTSKIQDELRRSTSRFARTRQDLAQTRSDLAVAKLEINALKNAEATRQAALAERRRRRQESGSTPTPKQEGPGLFDSF